MPNMWNTDSLWVEAALVMGFFAVGQVFFGHFELHTPKWKRIGKIVLLTAMTMAFSTCFGRAWALGFWGFVLTMVAVVHGIFLPRKGINGWTGEPKEKYYRMRGWEKHLNR